MTSPIQRIPLAEVHFAFYKDLAPFGTFALDARLPGVEPIHECFSGDRKSFDEMSAVAADAHNSWRTWGACFDEVMFAYVPNPSLF